MNIQEVTDLRRSIYKSLNKLAAMNEPNKYALGPSEVIAEELVNGDFNYYRTAKELIEAFVLLWQHKIESGNFSSGDQKMYVFARDSDHALELVGHQAAVEFETLADAMEEKERGEIPSTWHLFKVSSVKVFTGQG